MKQCHKTNSSKSKDSANLICLSLKITVNNKPCQTHQHLHLQPAKVLLCHYNPSCRPRSMGLSHTAKYKLPTFTYNFKKDHQPTTCLPYTGVQINPLLGATFRNVEPISWAKRPKAAADMLPCPWCTDQPLPHISCKNNWKRRSTHETSSVSKQHVDLINQNLILLCLKLCFSNFQKFTVR